MSPKRRQVSTWLRDHFSIRDRSPQKWSPAEQPTSSEHIGAQVQQQPESEQASSIAAYSSTTTATPSQNALVQTEANEEDTESGGKPSSKSDLWDKALTYLSESAEYDPDIVAIVKTFAGNPIGDNASTRGRPNSTEELAKDISERMSQAIQDGQHSREQREWKVTIGDKEYSARNLVEKTVNILNKFVAVGDVAVSFDPAHAALPWAAVRFVLVILTASSALRSQIVFGLAKTASLILQCDTYRRIYMATDPNLGPPADVLGLLETSIVHTYINAAIVLSFLRDAKRVALSFRQIVDVAPLQLYASALVFAPVQSIVGQTFKRYYPEWISLLPRVDLEWNAVLQTIEGHTGEVNSVVLSSDGELIASGSDDRTIKIWNVATGEEQRTLEGHRSFVNSVVFSSDGRLIASRSDDKTIKIWNAATGINVKSFDTSPYTDVLSFADNDSVLVTNRGSFSLEPYHARTPQHSKHEAKTNSSVAPGEGDGQLGFGICDDQSWITAGGPDGRKVLWLPPDFRGDASSTLTELSMSVVVIGCSSGRVVIIGFRWSSLLNGV